MYYVSVSEILYHWTELISTVVMKKTDWMIMADEVKLNEEMYEWKWR